MLIPTLPPLAQAVYEALFVEGNRRLAAGDVIGAEARFRAALDCAPDSAEAWGDLGLVLEQRGGAAAEAESCYRHAIALRPDLADLHLDLGALLAAARRHDEAAASYSRAIALDPASPAAWSNLGALLAASKHDDDAEAVCRKAIALDPAFAKARVNLAYLLLRQGRFEEGWACLEARDWYAALEARLVCPRWQGESLDGRTLLIGWEAGHGDVIQFCRYAALLKARWKVDITLLCQPALKALLGTLAGVDRVIGCDEALPAAGFDTWTPLLSLPHRMGTDEGSIPAALPYLQATADRTQHWRPRLAPDEAARLRVGLVWKGNPRFENDAERSLASLAVLAPLGRVAGVRFISLQKGAGEDEAETPPPGLAVTALGAAIRDFADTAAIVAQLDLVICVDTAVAHLAGALGRPCWVLLPHHLTDWRWLDTRTDSPWYPGVMRLFRQTRAGGWADVVERVAAALASFEAGRPESRYVGGSAPTPSPP